MNQQTLSNISSSFYMKYFFGIFFCVKEDVVGHKGCETEFSHSLLVQPQIWTLVSDKQTHVTTRVGLKIAAQSRSLRWNIYVFYFIQC